MHSLSNQFTVLRELIVYIRSTYFRLRVIHPLPAFHYLKACYDMLSMDNMLNAIGSVMVTRCGKIMANANHYFSIQQSQNLICQHTQFLSSKKHFVNQDCIIFIQQIFHQEYKVDSKRRYYVYPSILSVQSIRLRRIYIYLACYHLYI